MRFSIITPVFDPSARVLRQTLDSVLRQTEGAWEHCLVDDGSTDPVVREILAVAAARDPRVRVQFRRVQGGIVAASNDAMEMASGEFVVFLDHDDELHPFALERMAAAIDSDPEADYLYSDEDKVDGHGNHFDPFLKPHWSPERLQCQMYTGHLSVMRRSVVDAVGRLRPGFDGSQDWDLALRVSERARRITHVREILYHWRTVPGSAAERIDAKPWAFDAGKRAVTEHLRRIGFPATIRDYPGHPGQYQLQPDLADHPLVSIVIPTAGATRRVNGAALDLIVNCVRSVVERSTYGRYEIVAVVDHHAPAHIVPSLQEIAGDRLHVVRAGGPFNFSERVNLGVRRSAGDVLLVLNDDTEVLGDGNGCENGDRRSRWIETMLMYAVQPGIGSVGARLHLGDGRIQHAGIVFVNGNPQHAYYGFPADHVGYFANALIPANFLCATAACLMTRRDVFHQVGGFSLGFPVNFGDVDYGLKLHQVGLRTVVVPGAKLVHYESSSRFAQVSSHEIELMHQNWAQVMSDDPYYHPGFGTSHHFMPPPYLTSGRFWSPNVLSDR